MSSPRTSSKSKYSTPRSDASRLTSRGSKENRVSLLPRADRVQLVERDSVFLPLIVQAELLGVSRASFYYKAAPPSAEEVWIKHRIDERYTQYPFFGSRRITAWPRIWNSDQGSHFDSPRYIERLHEGAVQISMDGKGRAPANIFTERLWRSVKFEEIYLHDYTSPQQGLTRYLESYNHDRQHQALNYQTPAELYGGMHLAIQFANRLTLIGADSTLNKAALWS